MGHTKRGINPVTFRGKETVAGGKGMALTIARMHVTTTQGLRKWMPVVLSEGSEDLNPLGTLVLDEDHFLEGMGHLFPREGSMDHGSRSAASVNGELVSELKDAERELRIRGASEPADSIRTLLGKYGL